MKEEEEEYVTGEVDVVMKEGDCEAPEMTYLTFGTALPNNQAITVRRALQDVVLYLQMHGLPVYRFHADGRVLQPPFQVVAKGPRSLWDLVGARNPPKQWAC